MPTRKNVDIPGFLPQFLVYLLNVLYSHRNYIVTCHLTEGSFFGGVRTCGGLEFKWSYHNAREATKSVTLPNTHSPSTPYAHDTRLNHYWGWDATIFIKQKKIRKQISLNFFSLILYSFFQFGSVINGSSALNDLCTKESLSTFQNEALSHAQPNNIVGVYPEENGVPQTSMWVMDKCQRSKRNRFLVHACSCKGTIYVIW